MLDPIYPDFLKYAPKEIDECVLLPKNKKIFDEVVRSNKTENLIFYGGSGTGKTTSAKLLGAAVNADVLHIYAPEELDAQNLQQKIRTFSSTAPMFGEQKWVVIEEADELAKRNTFQSFLKSITEKFKSVTFIFTTNHIEHFSKALKSRFKLIDFDPASPTESEELFNLYVKRLRYMLEEEKVEYEEEALLKVSHHYCPDMRAAINNIGSHLTEKSGTPIGLALLLDNLSLAEPVDVGDFLEVIKNESVTSALTWLQLHDDLLDPTIFTRLSDQMGSLGLDRRTQNRLYVTIGEYAFRHEMMTNKKLNLTAFIASLKADFKAD